MKKLIELNVVAEYDLSLTARLLLILNRKRLELESMKLDTNNSSGYYKYNFQIAGDSNTIKQAIKVIAKQIGVLDVKPIPARVLVKKEMALA